jgi:hypothetical protein
MLRFDTPPGFLLLPHSKGEVPILAPKYVGCYGVIIIRNRDRIVSSLRFGFCAIMVILSLRYILKCSCSAATDRT